MAMRITAQPYTFPPGAYPHNQLGMPVSTLYRVFRWVKHHDATGRETNPSCETCWVYACLREQGVAPLEDHEWITITFEEE